LLFSLLTLLVTFQATTPAFAWGRLGHRVISRLAEKHLTPQARAAIAELLEPGESLADASLWADENRGRLPKTAPWHYVDVPLDEPAYDRKWSADDSKHGCVVDKINEFRLVVKDKRECATESLLAAREAYQDPRTGKRIKSGTKLGDEYQEKNLPVARRRLAQAGLRLAWVLNEAFADH
jgi:hypothetical protein